MARQDIPSDVNDIDNATIPARLAESLHVQPLTNAVGSAAAVIIALVAAASSAEPLLFVAAGLLALSALTKFVLGLTLSYADTGAARPRIRAAFMAMAVAQAALIGLFGGLTLILTGPGYASVLAVGYAFGFGSGIAMRHAGNPWLVNSQVVLCVAPTFVASLLSTSWELHVLAALLPLTTLVMISVARDLNARLTEQIVAGERQSQLSHEIRLQAGTDPVTGLRNRTGFADAAGKLARTLRPDCRLAVLWIDLHRFRDVNDTYGHEAGDRLLGEFARRLGDLAPEGAVLARYGGDDFLLACAVGNPGEAEALATDVIALGARALRLNGERVEIGACIGVALSGQTRPGEPGVDIDTLLRQADLAIFNARLAGRGEVRFFTTEMSRAVSWRKELEAELRAAIQKDELSVYFQPIIDLSTGRIRAFEALVRWFHPEKGEMRPDQFIPVAEKSGLIITLGNWITQTAARACATWPEHIGLAVNLSPAQIRAPGAALGVLAALHKAGLDPVRLELEVTESLFVEEDDNTTHFMEELAGAGVRFALDDFGTGTSSLKYVSQFPFHTIKVDRSFVSGPQTGPKSDAIIRAVAEMGSTLGMDICAEGLETAEQVGIVRKAGCTLGQGYYFSRAVPDHMAAKLLDEDREATGLRTGTA